MNAIIQNIINEIPAWRAAKSIAVEPQQGGLTNANYHLTVDGERFVLRVSGENTAQLGINRHTEYQALRVVSQAGIAPEVILFALPEGHLVTRFIYGDEWKMEEFKAYDVIRRVSTIMKRVHTLPPISGDFSPYRDIELRLENAEKLGVMMPEGLDTFLQKMYAIEGARADDLIPALCHNDPFCNNFIHNGSVYLVDWEFAGMGDIFFDLASVSYFFDQNQRNYLLECYFSVATRSRLDTLNQLWYVVAFWNATWAMLQIGNPHADFDYSGMVKNVFAKMTEML